MTLLQCIYVILITLSDSYYSDNVRSFAQPISTPFFWLKKLNFYKREISRESDARILGGG